MYSAMKPENLRSLQQLRSVFSSGRKGSSLTGDDHCTPRPSHASTLTNSYQCSLGNLGPICHWLWRDDSCRSAQGHQRDLACSYPLVSSLGPQTSLGSSGQDYCRSISSAAAQSLPHTLARPVYKGGPGIAVQQISSSA